MADIVCAAYHHPVLVTLSKAFHVLVYYLPPLGGNSSSGTLAGASTTASRGLSGPGATKPILARSIHSYSSYAPASMILTRAPALTSKPTSAPAAASGTAEENVDAQTTSDANSSTSTTMNMAFKLVLAYTVPVYPAHWTAGAAELGISISTIPASLSGKPPMPDVRITSSRTCSAITNGWGETPFGILSRPLAGVHGQNEDEGDQDEEDEDEEDPWRTVAPVPSTPVSSLLPFPTSFASTSSAAPVPTTANLSTPAGMTSLAREELVRRRYERAVEQYSRKIGHVVGIQTDGKWIVVAGGNNVLQGFDLPYHKNTGLPPPPTVSLPFQITVRV
ncbi:hypothetical protein DL93DRAFT_230756 [Clavulina sp. PMI_390]|nr:hypothetical protein DL93DRAFT_230756 [Clavulina sp. PMI_390]